MRPSNRTPEQNREIKITRHYTDYAEGSVLIEMGNTKVLCNASVSDSVPRFLRGKRERLGDRGIRYVAACDTYSQYT